MCALLIAGASPYSDQKRNLKRSFTMKLFYDIHLLLVVQVFYDLLKMYDKVCLNISLKNSYPLDGYKTITRGV